MLSSPIPSFSISLCSLLLQRIVHVIISSIPHIINRTATDVKPEAALTRNDASGIAATQTAPNKALLRARYSSFIFLTNSTLHILDSRDIAKPVTKDTTAIAKYFPISDLIKLPVNINEKYNKAIEYPPVAMIARLPSLPLI